ncbi:hypothetical protein H6501_00355 [Candidatus Woesearchaeota archaeon]|nr:hypothetical protein [Nanoarchaeota archaeon]MCB9370033.1 hypothetical protein [Candidatus Woesearchaeota archaeon]
MGKSYTINGKNVHIQVHHFEGKLSEEEYESQIFTALSKLGLEKQDIELCGDEEKNSPSSYARVTWNINGKSYAFHCDSQESYRQNLGAIAQALQEDTRQIMRGIKDPFLLMTQYENKEFLPPKRKNLLNFDTGKEEQFDPKSLSFNSVNTKEDLDPQYSYLLNYPSEKIEQLYQSFKIQCELHNRPFHPTFQALKIIRKRRGIE